MKKVDNNKYVNLKRKIYLIIFPLLTLSNGLYWLFSDYIDPFLAFALPISCLVFAVIWVFIYFQRFFRACEIIFLGLCTIYHFYRVQSLVGQIDDIVINVYAFWSPLYFFYVFMVLERKKALGYSLFIVLVSIAMGIPFFHHPFALDILLQYYISTILFTLILFYFQKLVTVYIKSDILRKNAYYDSLTEIGNRRLIDSWLEIELKRCRETKSIFSIIYFDIDYFKKINDSYGHTIGDKVLKEFAVNGKIESTEIAHLV